MNDSVPFGCEAEPLQDNDITRAMAPFTSIPEVAEIRVNHLDDSLLFYVFADMPTYSRTLLRRLVEAEYAALGSAPESMSLVFEFYPRFMVDTAREPFRSAAVRYKRK